MPICGACGECRRTRREHQKGADAIVTGDRDLLDNADLHAWLRDRGIRLITPAGLVERI
jgi:hypothetical protein